MTVLNTRVSFHTVGVRAPRQPFPFRKASFRCLAHYAVLSLVPLM